MLAKVKLCSFFLLIGACSLTPVTVMQAQFPGQGRNGGGDNGGTKLNLGALGDINNSTPKAIPQRVLEGVVRDKDGAPVKGATVYLKGDSKSTGLRSVTSDEKGTFRFVQLSRTAEYTVWAQLQDKKSPTKSVSSFETKDDLLRNLQLQ